VASNDAKGELPMISIYDNMPPSTFKIPDNYYVAGHPPLTLKQLADRANRVDPPETEETLS
jgi:hypothetical protein